MRIPRKVRVGFFYPLPPFSSNRGSEGGSKISTTIQGLRQ